MSLVNIFKNNQPEFGNFSDIKQGSTSIEFEAVFDDTYTGGVTYTEYPIESGASVVDHAIIMPNRYTLTIAVGDKPLGLSSAIGGIALGAISNEIGGIGAAALGVAAGIFGDAASAKLLKDLIELKDKREPFTMNTGEIVLDNMVIENITREKTPDNETGTVIVLELRELQRISNLIESLQPNPDMLNPTDNASTQAVGLNDLGEVMASPFGGVA